jgi:hypothetical protein
MYQKIINGKYSIIKFEFYKKNGRTKKQLQYETYMHNKFYNAKVGAPKPYFGIEFKSSGKDVYVSGMKLDPYAVNFGLFNDLLTKKNAQPIVLDYIIKSIDAVLNQMCEKNLVHGDLHWDNIGFQDMNSQSKTVLIEFPMMQNYGVYNYVSPLVIDFGFAGQGACNPDLEILQLVRTLFPDFEGGSVKPFNRSYLYPRLMSLLDKYGKVYSSRDFPDMPRWNNDWDYELIDDSFAELQDKYMRNVARKIREWRP